MRLASFSKNKSPKSADCKPRPHEQHLRVERHCYPFLSKNHSTACCCLTTPPYNMYHIYLLSQVQVVMVHQFCLLSLILWIPWPQPHPHQTAQIFPENSSIFERLAGCGCFYVWFTSMIRWWIITQVISTEQSSSHHHHFHSAHLMRCLPILIYETYILLSTSLLLVFQPSAHYAQDTPSIPTTEYLCTMRVSHRLSATFYETYHTPH